MKSACLVLLFIMAPGGAQAGTYALALGADKPVATITLPDDWKPAVSDHGLEAVSPDGTSFIVAKMIKPDEKSAADFNVDTTHYIESQGVTFPPVKDETEPKTTDTDIKVNGLDTFVSRLDDPTTFKGAPTTVTYYAIPFGTTQTLNIITRGAKDDKALAGFVATVQPIK